MESGIKRVSQIWHRSPGGLLIPDGYESQQYRTETSTFIAVKDKAMQLEKLAHNTKVPIPPTSDLAALVHSAKDLSEKWILGRWDEIPRSMIFDSAHFNRIAEALLPLAGTLDFDRYLRILTKGQLDLFARDQSQPKNYLWEAELLTLLRKHAINAELREPDIVATFEGQKIGIACKKIYSEKNLEKVFSKGVKQVESAFDFGLVAFNIDDILPQNYVLQARDQKESAERINAMNREFISRHERHFRKYLSGGRVLSSLVSMSVIVKFTDDNVGTQRQSTIWMIPDLPPEKQAMFNRLYKTVMN